MKTTVRTGCIGVVRVVASLGFAAVLLVARPSLAEETGVHGRVLGQTETGEHLGPVAGAQVEFLEGGTPAGSTTTDGQGYYRINTLKPGKYEYRLVASGFREEKEGRGFELKVEGASVLDFVVTREMPSEDPENKKPRPRRNPGRNSTPPAPNDPKNDPASKTPKPADSDPTPDASPADGMGMLGVWVMVEAGGEREPVRGATVRIRRTDGGEILDGSTGRRGFVRFELPPADWRILASAPGYEPKSHAPVTVRQGARSPVTIVLTKIPEKPSAEANPDAGSPASNNPASGESSAEESQTSFFGAKARGNRIALLVDNSLSMKEGRFEQATTELMKTVKSLSERQKFYVIFFSDTLHPMFEPNSPADMVPASWLNVTRLERTLTDRKLQRGTNAREAAEKAISLKPDVIFILSDGNFTDATRPFLMRLKKDGQMKIHTIGFRSSERGAETLKAIADKFAGTYTEVP